MKKQLIIFSVILIFLSLISFFIGFTIQKTKLNKQINYLTIENKNIQKEKEHLIKQIKVLEDKKEEKSSINTVSEYKHPIDIAEELCINNTNSLLYHTCSIQSIKDWKNEINTQLKKMQTIMNKTEYKHIQLSQTKWEESVNNDELIINRFITEKQGFIYKTIGYSYIADIYRQRSILLEEILTNNMNLSAMRDKKISSKFISLEDFLSDNSDLKWSETKLNAKGEVTFQNKIILNNEGVPLKDDTANTTTEMEIMIVAKGIKPKPNCDESDTINNGTFGCYIDIPDETTEEENSPSSYFNNLYDLSNNFIDIEQQKCYSFSHPYDFPTCGEKAEQNWDKIISKYLSDLKNTLPRAEYNDLLRNQTQWEKFVEDSKILINKYIIADKKTTHNLTSATRNMTLIKKQRAFLLESIYHQSSERNKIQN